MIFRKVSDAILNSPSASEKKRTNGHTENENFTAYGLSVSGFDELVH